MLAAEEARARLAALANDDWARDARRRAGRVRRANRAVATTLVEAAADPNRYSTPTVERFRLGAAALERLDDKQRLEVFEALHPALGRALNGWWVAARGEPYLTGFYRRAFRAPGAPELTLDRRAATLGTLLRVTGPYGGDAEWLAAWAPFLPDEAAHVAGGLLAAAVDAGDQRVLDTLLACANGTHPVGVMGRHVVVGLLRSSRADAWEVVERLLLAAQRQEGLRQVVLEAADEAHPIAFDRLLALVEEQNLLRFAAAARAVGVWLGLPGTVEQLPALRARLAAFRRFRSDAAAATAAIGGGDPEAAYLALCAIATHDVVPAMANAEWLAQQADRDARAVAARFAATASLRSGQALLLRLLDDPDLDVAALAHALVDWRVDAAGVAPLERLARRLPEKPAKGARLGVETEPVPLSRAAVVSSLVVAAPDLPADRLLPWVPHMDAGTRASFAAAAGRERSPSPEVRRALVALTGDRGGWARDLAVEALSRSTVTPDEAREVEAFLTRRTGDLRRGIIALLAKQPAAAALASAERLWASGDEPRRDAACELLRALPGRSRAVAALAARFAADGATERQRELLGAADPDAPDPDDPWAGLYDPARRAPVPPPRAPRRPAFVTDAARRAVGLLDDVAHQHRDTQVVVESWQGTRDMLLGDVRQELSWPMRAPRAGEDESAVGMVLGDVFRAAWADRPPDCRDAGPRDALRAYVAALLAPEAEDRGLLERRFGGFEAAELVAGVAGRGAGVLRYPELVRNVLSWLVVDEADAGVVDECLDGVEAVLAALPLDQLKPRDTDPWNMGRWRWPLLNLPWLALLEALLQRRPELFDATRTARWFALMRWLDEPAEGFGRKHPQPALLLRAHELGGATDHDVLDALLHEQTRLLGDYTRRHRAPLAARHPRAVALADAVRDRVVAVERARGDLPTPATPLARALSSVSGVTLLAELLARMGRSALVRGWVSAEGREVTFSHLIRVCYPGDGETGADLRAAAAERKIPDKRLVELAVYAPQWGALVEDALGWSGLEDAVWWFHAHTKDDQWQVPVEVREAWAARWAERTPLTAHDLVSGAVDVDWFGRAYATLGAERWAVVHAAAKLASSGGGHKRAQLYAEAMLGVVGEDALRARIAEKRHQDAVRALGLVPLPDDPDARQAAALARYGVLLEFHRQAAQFGSMRQASERQAVSVAVDNLARTAGYPDPQRFVWAMEAAEAGDLADGPVAVERGDVTVTLAVSEEGVPEVTTRRAGKPLSAVPAALRKDPEIVALRERKTALARQATRVRRSLEDAMVRQEPLTPADLAALDRHPVVAPMLRMLVFVDEDGRTARRSAAGFTDAGGAPVAVAGSVRVAHPVDLVAAGDWVRWQETYFAEGRKQPFKQVFRELYVVTRAELDGGPVSERYAGHQLQPAQAIALLGGRGWLNDRESGEASRSFHAHGLVARLTFLDGFLTPLEAELPTVGGVLFTRRGEWLAQPLDGVPPVVFSEAMRDVDLVVSVAHAGGVDPEATASTVEMRAALVRETVRLMRLGNVEVAGSHAVIDGALGEYTVHLGSGVVHRRPGGAVCIIPVDSQRRGRVFLPFADDDPRTAEVVAKVLMLARDTQIKDPTILEQLR